MLCFYNKKPGRIFLIFSFWGRFFAGVLHNPVPGGKYGEGFTYGDLSLKEIAADVGMKNVTHLNALIRKHYGRTPGQLRREYRSAR